MSCRGGGGVETVIRLLTFRCGFNTGCCESLTFSRLWDLRICVRLS